MQSPPQLGPVNSWPGSAVFKTNYFSGKRNKNLNVIVIPELKIFESKDKEVWLLVFELILVFNSGERDVTLYVLLILFSFFL